MTQDEKRKAAIAVYHDPNAHQSSMVYSVWEDGEVTLEKGGELFGQRNLHCINPADPTVTPWPIALFPMTNSAHGRILCTNNQSADEFRQIIKLL